MNLIAHILQDTDIVHFKKADKACNCRNDQYAFRIIHFSRRNTCKCSFLLIVMKLFRYCFFRVSSYSECQNERHLLSLFGIKDRLRIIRYLLPYSSPGLWRYSIFSLDFPRRYPDICSGFCQIANYSRACADYNSIAD